MWNFDTLTQASNAGKDGLVLFIVFLQWKEVDENR